MKTIMELTAPERRLILQLKEKDILLFENSGFSQDDFNSATLGLKAKGLVSTIETNETGCIMSSITDAGRIYLFNNPKAKNQFLTKKRMWFMGLLLTLILAVLGLLFK